MGFSSQFGFAKLTIGGLPAGLFPVNNRQYTARRIFGYHYVYRYEICVREVDVAIVWYHLSVRLCDTSRIKIWIISRRWPFEHARHTVVKFSC